MPIYEYRCEKCGEFEHSQRITAPALQRCPTCKRKVRRLISNTSFQLKGSGWYVTDYAGGGSKGGAIKSETSASGDAKPTESKPSESKTESKTESKPATPAPASTSTKSD